MKLLVNLDTPTELSSLNIEDVDRILKYSYDSKDKFWMSAAAISYFEKPYGINYIDKKTLTGRFLDRIILFIEIGGERYDKSKKSVFTPNTMK